MIMLVCQYIFKPTTHVSLTNKSHVRVKPLAQCMVLMLGKKEENLLFADRINLSPDESPHAVTLTLPTVENRGDRGDKQTVGT